MVDALLFVSRGPGHLNYPPALDGLGCGWLIAASGNSAVFLQEPTRDDKMPNFGSFGRGKRTEEQECFLVASD